MLLGHSVELGPVVIKSSPLADEFRAEATALSVVAGETVSRLYDVYFRRSVMVTERIVPGTQLRHVPMSDERATHLAAEMAMTFWRTISEPGDLIPLRRWLRALFDWSPTSDQVDPERIRHAQDLPPRYWLDLRVIYCCTGIFNTTISSSERQGSGRSSIRRG